LIDFGVFYGYQEPLVNVRVFWGSGVTKNIFIGLVQISPTAMGQAESSNPLPILIALPLMILHY